MGLWQGCPISATRFVDGLHHYLETAVPMDGIRILQMRLRELVLLSLDFLARATTSPD